MKVFQLRNVFADPLVLAAGRYYGFAIGPDSHHDELGLTYGGQRLLLAEGGWTPCSPEDAAPEVVPIHPTWLSVASIESGDVTADTSLLESRAHIIAAECPEELAFAVTRRPALALGVWRFDSSSGSNQLAAILPARGRRHIRLISGSNDTELDIYGQSWDREGASMDDESGSVDGRFDSTGYRNVGTPYEPRNATVGQQVFEALLGTLSTTGQLVFGGTDAAERWDTLAIKGGTGPAWDATISVELT